MKYLTTIIVLLHWTAPLFGQPNAEEVKSIIQTVANRVLDHTSFKIVNSETGEQYDSALGLPVTGEIRIENEYNAWKYWNGVLNMSLIDLGNTVGVERYTDYARRNVAFAFDNVPYFKKQYEQARIDRKIRQFFRMAYLDDVGAMAASVLDVYQYDKRADYKQYIEKAANYIMYEEFRLNDGTLVRERPVKMTLWGDDLYMSVPFLARMGTLTSDNKYFDEAARQVIQFTDYLYDDKKEIYYHIYFDDIKQNGVAHWGRCNGWIMMAQVELLERFPDDHPQRDTLISILQQHILGVSRYQSQSGLWYQLLDKTDSYLETSASAMFTYAIAKAIANGWIERRYASIAFEGWNGIQTKIRDTGEVEGICRGTGVENDLPFYYKRGTPLNDIHGIGPVIMAGSEIIKLIEFEKNKGTWKTGRGNF